MLDIEKLLVELRARRDTIDQVIQALSQIQSPPVSPGRRGRKFMNAEQRQEVSERMRHYWSQRRAGAS